MAYIAFNDPPWLGLVCLCDTERQSEINRFEAKDIHTVTREMIIYIAVDTVNNSACSSSGRKNPHGEKEKKRKYNVMLVTTLWLIFCISSCQDRMCYS